MMTEPILAIDIGASGVKAALVVNDRGWSIAKRLQTKGIQHRTFAELRAAVEASVSVALVAEPALRRIGISTTGSANSDSIVLSSGFFAGYQNVNWLTILGESSGGRIRTVRVMNDGRAAAFGTFLADSLARGLHLIHFVVGTGVGGGMVWDGVVFHGSHNFAGAYGHIKVTTDTAERCVCGGRGCVELFAAAPAVVRYATAAGESKLHGIRDLAERARRGSEPAREAFRTAGRWLAVAIGSAANVCDPAIVTVGGGVIAAARDGCGGNWYVDSAAEAARGMVIPRIADHLRVVEASLLNDAALIGAAALASA